MRQGGGGQTCAGMIPQTRGPQSLFGCLPQSVQSSQQEFHTVIFVLKDTMPCQHDCNPGAALAGRCRIMCEGLGADLGAELGRGGGTRGGGATRWSDAVERGAGARRWKDAVGGGGGERGKGERRWARRWSGGAPLCVIICPFG